MPIYNFRAFEVDFGYFGEEDGSILNEVTLSISDTDSLLHANSATDPANDQLFSIDGGPFDTNYEVDFQDFVVLNGGGPEYEVFTFSVSGTPERYYVFSKDPGFDPTAGDGITVSRYNSFENTEYSAIESAVCFAAGTGIRTPQGDVAVETLKLGDLVCTLDSGNQPILWSHKRTVTEEQMRQKPALKPVLIKLDVEGCEERLMVSQQHAVSLRSFDGAHGLLPDAVIRAKHVTQYFGRAGRIAHGKKGVSYYHFLLPSHQLVWANGILAETLFLGPQAKSMIGKANLRYVNRKLRENADAQDSKARMRADTRVRKMLTGKEIRSLLARNNASLPFPLTASHPDPKTDTQKVAGFGSHKIPKTPDRQAKMSQVRLSL